MNDGIAVCGIQSKQPSETLMDVEERQMLTAAGSERWTEFEQWRDVNDSSSVLVSRYCSACQSPFVLDKWALCGRRFDWPASGVTTSENRVAAQEVLILSRSANASRILAGRGLVGDAGAVLRTPGIVSAMLKVSSRLFAADCGSQSWEVELAEVEVRQERWSSHMDISCGSVMNWIPICAVWTL